LLLRRFLRRVVFLRLCHDQFSFSCSSIGRGLIGPGSVFPLYRFPAFTGSNGFAGFTAS
jgi:hypothetical protein